MPDLTSGDDIRYKGKKASRKSLKKSQEGDSDNDDDTTALDQKEHAAGLVTKPNTSPFSDNSYSGTNDFHSIHLKRKP